MASSAVPWGVGVVKHADSHHRGFQFNSSMYHFQNGIGEEGNGKPSHEFHFPRNKLRALSLVSATLEIEYATQVSVLLILHRHLLVFKS